MLAKTFPERYRRWGVLVPVSLVFVYVLQSLTYAPVTLMIEKLVPSFLWSFDSRIRCHDVQPANHQNQFPS